MPTFLQELIDRLQSLDRRIVIGVTGVIAVLLIWSISYWATRPEWVVLMPGLDLESVGEVTTRLDEERVPYRLQRGGTEIQVNEKDLARTRVLLAQSGIPRKGRPGFELFDQPSWGMTDFTQRVNYRRALEGELERTISQMRGIESAQVHLAIRESTSVFRRNERPAEASVFLKLRTGLRPSGELVEAITFLVAGSVDGLSSESVTVLDDAGRVLSAAIEPGVTSGLTKRQIALQREVENYLEMKAEDLVAEVVGRENVRVRISAVLNFDQIDRTTQAVDPDQQATLREERSEIVPTEGAPGGISTIENTSYEVTRTIERFTGGQGNLRRMTIAVLLNDRFVQGEDGAHYEPRSPEELERVESLVRNAVGFDPTRGDDISVVGIPFDIQPSLIGPDERPGILVRMQTMKWPLLIILGGIIILIVTLQLLRRHRLAQLEAALQDEIDETPALEASDTEELEEEEEEKVLEPVDIRPLVPKELSGHAQILATIDERPENAVRVIRAWLREV